MQVPAQITISPDLDTEVAQRAYQAIQQAAETWAKRRSFPDWLSKGESAQYANVSRGTLEQFIKHGLRYSRINQTVRIKRDDIDKFLQDHSY